MQVNSTLRSMLVDYAGYILAMFVAVLNGMGWLVVYLLTGRRRQSAEIHESVARANRDDAEAAEIKMRATFDLGEEAVAVTRKLLRAQEIIFDLHKELAKVKEERDELREQEQRRA